MKRTIIYSLLLISTLLSYFHASATHIRAGEIIARRIDNLTPTYEFTFVGYRDRNSQILFGNGEFDLGDGTVIPVETTEFTRTIISSTIERAEYRIRHTYNSVRSYVVSYREENRNAGISNMQNSVNTPFYVETMIVIDPFLGNNSSPVLTVPPIDEGTPGVVFIHNPGAFDEDGDILTYQLVVPRQSEDEEVFGYVPLDDPQFYNNWSQGSEQLGPAEFFLEEESGDLIWNAPGDDYKLRGDQCPDGVDDCSEYNVAFRITEWRDINGRLEMVGYVTRDMQLVVYEGDNEKPELEVPPNLCVEAGDTVNELVTGTDPDGHAVKIEAFGGPFEVNSAATYEPSDNSFQDPPGFLQFNWETVCGHVRERPYEVQFKVTDNPIEDGEKVGPSLVNFGSWEITVVGPQPTGLAVNANTGRSTTLNWNRYSCSNASFMQIWRRVGDYAFDPGVCEVGIPAEAGYELIDVVGISDTTFNDFGLAPGANYCYRLVAIFPAPGGGLSYASDEVCLTLQSDAPVITNVDVKTTDQQNGEIEVRWTPPYEADPVLFPPPYTYNVYRSEGLSTTIPELVFENTADTVFLDQGLDTFNDQYYYRVDLFDAGGNYVDSSATASSVRLQPLSVLSAVELNWSADVPWSNTVDDNPFHYVYRDNVAGDAGQLVLIDSVNVTRDGFVYLDDGRFNGVVLDDEIEYCYYVSTVGTYDNSPLIPDPLINNSQIACARPNDNTPPCTPLALISTRGSDCESFLNNVGCNFTEYFNEMSWEADFTGECEDDVARYRIYFSPTGLAEDYLLIDSTTENSFRHEGLSSFKGAYRISAVDRSFNESGLSEPLFFDNCPNFILPNVFTPNDDGVNDLFTPFFNGSGQQISNFDNANCPRFVQAVEFEVFNRQGSKVFDLASQPEQSILINWDGRSNGGADLPSGTYFYVARVTFDVLNPEEAEQEYRGWVQLLR
jgi:gliding motility-associated-like protein